MRGFDGAHRFSEIDHFPRETTSSDYPSKKYITPIAATAVRESTHEYYHGDDSQAQKRKKRILLLKFLTHESYGNMLNLYSIKVFGVWNVVQMP